MSNKDKCENEAKRRNREALEAEINRLLKDRDKSGGGESNVRKTESECGRNG